MKEIKFDIMEFLNLPNKIEMKYKTKKIYKEPKSLLLCDMSPFQNKLSNKYNSKDLNKVNKDNNGFSVNNNYSNNEESNLFSQCLDKLKRLKNNYSTDIKVNKIIVENSL